MHPRSLRKPRSTRLPTRPRRPAPAPARQPDFSRAAVSQPVYTIGVDFGTESGRALLLDPRSGEELAVEVVPYPSAVIDRTLPGTGERLPPDWALQDPDDWVTVIETGLPGVLAQADAAPEQVVGIGVDFPS